MLTDRIVDISWQAAEMQAGEEADRGIIGAELAGDGMGQGRVEDHGFGRRDHLEPRAGLPGAEGEEIRQFGTDPAGDADQMQFEPLEGAVDGDHHAWVKPRHRTGAEGGGQTFGKRAGRSAGRGAEGMQAAQDRDAVRG